MTVEDKIDDKELKDINPQRDDYEDEIIQIIKSDEPAYKKKEELDDFRMKVLEQEHKAVQALKHKADFFVDFDTALEIFHL